jgi:hypothetical protein
MSCAAKIDGQNRRKDSLRIHLCLALSERSEKLKIAKNGNLGMKHALPRHFVEQTDQQKHLVAVSQAERCARVARLLF